jgi:hypothetical protein
MVKKQKPKIGRMALMQQTQHFWPKLLGIPLAVTEWEKRCRIAATTIRREIP